MSRLSEVVYKGMAWRTLFLLPPPTSVSLFYSTMRLTVIYPIFVLALSYVSPVASSCNDLEDCIESGKRLMLEIATSGPVKYANGYQKLEEITIEESSFKSINDIMQ